MRSLFRRAEGLGATSGLLALILWPFHDRNAPLHWAFFVLAALAGLCGAYVAAATVVDFTFRRRGERLRPVRGFDLIVGGGLFLLALLQLRDALGAPPPP